ncbi:MAG: hypothetical protein RMM31_01600 [Anaerolineae bacterium]|nr:hypothetical protein [Anaerolineae bacterium]
MEPIGFNVGTFAGGTNLTTNNLIWNSGMEPAYERYLVRVENTSEDPDPNAPSSRWFSWSNLGGVHMYEQNYTGFGDGATVRFYRLVDADGQPITYTNYLSGWMRLPVGAQRVISLGVATVPAGGWIAEGNLPTQTNRVYITPVLPLRYGDHAVITLRKTSLVTHEVHPRIRSLFQPNVGILNAQTNVSSATLEAHDYNALPPEFIAADPGETALKLTFSGAGRAGQFLLRAHTDEQWYSQLVPGATYRVDVWLKQQGLTNGRVRFRATGGYQSITQPDWWNVTNDWRRYLYTFTAPAFPTSTALSVLALEVDSAGTLWVDNFLVYRYDADHSAPFVPHKYVLDELMLALPPRGRKPALRFYTHTYAGHQPIERLVSNYPSADIDNGRLHLNVRFNPNMNLTMLQALQLALATGDSPDTRVVPYFTLSEEYVEEDWLKLVEYLGVPYDPSTDAPASKPLAHLRYTQRGHGRPWTDEFREIILEFGNETWHAGTGGYGWHGFGEPGVVNWGGQEYGLFAQLYFGEHVMGHPWWHQHNLGSKIKFALNANYDARFAGKTDLARTSYGELAAVWAPTVTTYLGHANYVGPKWETGEVPFQTFDITGLQKTVAGAFLGNFKLLDDISRVRHQLVVSGLAQYRVVAYEGGPSGYYVPGTGSVTQTAISQLYGKSLAMATAAMDTWLYSSQTGYAAQQYFSFAGGKNWTSHTMPLQGGFRRHAAWLALMMRNRYARGSAMLRVNTISVPTHTLDGRATPLVATYAITGERTLAVFVLSRKVPGQHHGADFGDGSTPVTLRLPVQRCLRVTRYALTAPDGSFVHPETTNLDETRVAITAFDVPSNECNDSELQITPATGGAPGGLPPGTVFLYVFELADHTFLPRVQR